MIKVSKYINMEDFKPWCGAVSTFNKVYEANKMEELEELIEEIFGEPTEMQINDLLWFEDEFIFESLGI